MLSLSMSASLKFLPKVRIKPGFQSAGVSLRGNPGLLIYLAASHWEAVFVCGRFRPLWQAFKMSQRRARFDWL